MNKKAEQKQLTPTLINSSTENLPGWTISTGFRASFCRVDHSALWTNEEDIKYFFIKQR